jgi:hypothetical protein
MIDRRFAAFSAIKLFIVWKRFEIHHPHNRHGLVTYLQALAIVCQHQEKPVVLTIVIVVVFGFSAVVSAVAIRDLRQKDDTPKVRKDSTGQD